MKDQQVISFKQVNPFLTSAQGSLNKDKTDSSVLLSLDIEYKYQYYDKSGRIIQEYRIPGSPEIHNCGGYIDKIFKYRDPELKRYIKKMSVSSRLFGDSRKFPILSSRSPKLDYLIFQYISHLRNNAICDRVRILDHGCTVAEHLDLLDTFLEVGRGERAKDVLSYYGIDISALALFAAQEIHRDLDPSHFHLIHTEGSKLEFEPSFFDITFSVGVVNYVKEPLNALKSLLRSTKYVSVLALWVTANGQGFWSINHTGSNFYFFSLDDIKRLEHEFSEGKFFYSEFIPEENTSQPSSYIGLGSDETKILGCYHLVFSKIDFFPLECKPLF
jgi:SAM-dependent methyltransferase